MSKILLVEDDFSMAKSLFHALSDAGFAVQYEGDAGHAIDAAEKFDFDAAIIDVDQDEQVAQGIRACDSELPIFVCTSSDNDSLAKWATEDRVLVLEKPVDEATLVWLLRAHVGSLG